MTRTFTELAFLLLGLLAGTAFTWACAWSYPIGAATVWWCGGAAMAAGVALAVRPLRDAWRADRAAGAGR